MMLNVVFEGRESEIESDIYNLAREGEMCL